MHRRSRWLQRLRWHWRGANVASFFYWRSSVLPIEPLTANFQGVYGGRVLTPPGTVGQNSNTIGPSTLMTDGTDAASECDVRASEGRPLAESGHAPVPGESRGRACVRP